MSLKARREVEKKKGIPTYLVPKEKKVREVVERERSWAGFYTDPALPQALRQFLHK